MRNYQDMRIFCLQNGGEYAEKVKQERAARYGGAWSLRFPFEVKEYQPEMDKKADWDEAYGRFLKLIGK